MGGEQPHPMGLATPGSDAKSRRDSGLHGSSEFDGAAVLLKWTAVLPVYAVVTRGRFGGAGVIAGAVCQGIVLRST